MASDASRNEKNASAAKLEDGERRELYQDEREQSERIASEARRLPMIMS